MTTTLVFIMDAKSRRFSAYFLHSFETDTVKQARSKYADFVGGNFAAACLEPGEIAIGVTFEGKTLDDIERGFPFYFGGAADEFSIGGRGHE